ncbi:MAG TPA: hypothetical protein VK797_09155 [Tepidisphaeraceae bacterium]|nr:hypothetical protein [Tepidisphaeraceae bacterium]
MNWNMNITRIAVLALIVGAWASAAEPAPDEKQVSGVIVKADAGSMVVAPLSHVPGASVDNVVVKLDPQKTRVSRQEHGGAAPAAAAPSDLKPGQRILARSENGAAVEVRILPPPPVSGRIVAVSAHSVTVKHVLPTKPPLVTEQSYEIDDRTATIMLEKVQNGPTTRGSVSDLKPGQSVMLWGDGRRASELRLVPPAPIVGTLHDVSPTAITISATTRPSQPAAGNTFQIDAAHTDIFEQYFGESAQPAAFSVLAAGDTVAVTIDGGSVSAITLMHPAIYGKITAVGPSSITVLPKGEVPTGPTREFAIDSGSAIYLGKEDHSSKLPSGKTVHFWRYLPGGKIADLRVGELVSITAKGTQILSMRVTPRTAKADAGKS